MACYGRLHRSTFSNEFRVCHVRCCNSIFVFFPKFNRTQFVRQWWRQQFSNEKKNREKSDCFDKSGSRMLCNHINMREFTIYVIQRFEPDIFHYFGEKNQKSHTTNKACSMCAHRMRSTDSKKISRRCIFNQIHRALSRDHCNFVCDRIQPAEQEKKNRTHHRNLYSANIFACFHAVFDAPSLFQKIWESD